ncbi:MULTISPECIES: VOC family protein [unclassified Paenibacillus]|uniref:VOC family protein n=1 Tax=unclassified Paenibacillus TaxID=185978 RepID=UPI00020D72E4|nr:MULTISPECIES: VOC family protein [unclassified Paenibacillus]EGL15809.1 3-demethylubiquinone-9 3-methyltransferase domain protein [Paenibacillus sp. HGF7]EPD88253.1 hypothetical protein HMPREF1207_02427 [Paenibacillus sp. HGH0039]
MAVLRPYLYSENAREQGAFYARALRGEIVNIQTFGDAPAQYGQDRDRVMHLVLKACGLTFYMADSDRVERGSGLDLTLEFGTDAEAEQIFGALSEGGKVLMPLQRMFWGTMFGRIEDAYGVRWQIATESAINQVEA